MSAAYWTAGRVESLRRTLAERDLDIVHTLGVVRLATCGQLQQLHFHGVPSSPRQCRRALARLVTLDVLTRSDRATGGRGGGSQSFTFALGVAGQRLAASGGPAHGQRWRRPWLPSQPFVAHALAVSELYVRLVAAERRGAPKLLGFEAEPACWRAFPHRHGGRAIVKPDAYLRLATDDDNQEEAWMIEVDRSTETRPTLARKLQTYRDYWTSGTEQRRYGAFPQVLWLVPDDGRRQVLQQLVEAQPSALRSVHLVAVFDSALQVLHGAQL